MSEKRVTVRFSEIEFLSIKDKADSVGVSVAEMVRALTGRSDNSEAASAIIERMDELESRLMEQGGNHSQFDQMRAAIERQDETLLSITKAINKMFDHLSQRPASTPAVPPESEDLARKNAAPLAASQPPEPPKPTPAASWRRAPDGLFNREYTESGSGISRPEWYSKNLRMLVERHGFDARVSAEHYRAAGVQLPPDFAQ